MIKNSVSAFAVLFASPFLSLAEESDHISEEMVVTANRFPQPKFSVLAPTTVVTREDINRWQAVSVLDVMARLPSVDSVQNGGIGQLSSLFTRGTNSNHVLILVDGIRLNQAGISGSSDLSQIPISLVQRVEYIRGSRSAVYGSDAIGGVINIITDREGTGSVLSMSLGSHGYQMYDYSTQQALGENSVGTLAGNYTGTKGIDVVANLPDGAGTPAQPDRDGFISKALFGSIKHTFNQQIRGFLRGYGYDNRTSYDGYYDLSHQALVNIRKLYSQTWDTGISYQQERLASQLVASYSHSKDYNYDPAIGQYAPSAALDNVAQYNVQWGNTYRIAQGNIGGGVDWQKQATESGTSHLFNGYTLNNSGIYMTAQQLFGAVTLEGSLRSDKNSQFGLHSTWQFGAAWEFFEGYRLITSYGTAYKAPNLGQLYSDVYGNTSLKPEESKQWEMGVEGLTGVMNWRISAYHHDVQRLIDNDPVTYRYYNIGEARIEGVEATAAFDIASITHQFSYDYVDPRNSRTNEVLLRRAKQQIKYEMSGQLKKIEWALAYHYLGQRQDKNFNHYPADIIKFGGVSLWDATLSYPITENLKVRGRISNLFDKNYEMVYGYRTPGREYYFSGSYNF